jgi:predicted PurR-regulated permease PerM
MGLNFSLLIGLAVGLLALIPYVGLTICWIPAVLIAVAQFGDWTHPLIVTAIFVGMSNLESFFIAPRVVGDSVSLHPLTVILSVLIWSLVLGVLLGALLAVPLTATIKVLLQRYVWHRRF